MKTLLLLRHAKSSWAREDLPDHDRPLNKRGKRDAPRMGQMLRENQLVPELILSSTAKRARKTAAKVARQCRYEGVIELAGELYLAPAGEYLQVLRQIPDHVSLAMVVGHNPGAEELLALLTGCTMTLPTAALARVELDLASWRQLAAETPANLVSLWRPRELE
jgi:phosphohistidine phosphatase